MNEAIERAAQALFDAIWENVGRSWPRWNDGATDRQKTEARIAARAAIISLRIPTDEMWKAAKRHIDSEASNGAFWRSMIDAAAAD